MRSLMGRFAALVCVGVVVSLAGCGPEDPGAGSSPGAESSWSPSASPSASRSESAEDRETRERGEHAIEVYEKADAELYALLHEGAGKPSEQFGAYAAGSYYDAAAELLEQVASDGARLQGNVERVGIWTVGNGSDHKVSFVACEDSSASRYVNKEGDALPNDEPFVIQRGEVESMKDEEWKVTYVESSRVASFEGTECADAG